MTVRDSSSEHWDEADFRAVFLQHYARIVAILVRLLGERSRAEEVANDAFWRLYRKPALRVDGNLGGWLYRTATNLGIDALRASSRRRQYEEAAGSARSRSASTHKRTVRMRFISSSSLDQPRCPRAWFWLTSTLPKHLDLSFLVPPV